MTPRDMAIHAERLRRLRAAEAPAEEAKPEPESAPARKVPLAVPVEPKVKK